jgi:dTDP-4-dehydrorhamnose reductase
MATILITGANGQLGSELKAASHMVFGHKLLFTDIDNTDITDINSVKKLTEKEKPDWIINCAAYNLVDQAESEPEKADLINNKAVRNIADVIRDSSVKFIHLSTDFVFDGTKTVPYKENEAGNPLSVYGRSKLNGEKSALSHPWTMVIRTSWLYSQYGHNFVKTILRLSEEKDSIAVVDDQTGSPTYAADLAKAILQIIVSVNNNQNAFNSGIFHYSNRGQCTWYDFASAIVRLSGRKCSVNRISSTEFGAKAKRPSYSVMSVNKISDNYGLDIPEWEESLKICLKKILKQ